MPKYSTVFQVLLQLVVAATKVKMNAAKKTSEQEHFQPFLHKTCD